MLTADLVLGAITGEMTASAIAERLGREQTPISHCSAREVVPLLNQLRQEGKVLRRVDARNESRPVVRWAVAA